MAAFPVDPGSASRPRGLDDPASVIRALANYHGSSEPRSGSLMLVSQTGRRATTDGYGYAFLARVEEHEELVRRLRRLEPRERLLLLLWYAEGWAVTDIAARLQISRVHCYRLRDRALDQLTSPVEAPPRLASAPDPREQLM
jgi:DNA-directed RNA polymerase specialized sigma24 family protein